jgi:oxygen-independent coproporphyrinogen-3 oxidase
MAGIYVHIPFCKLACHYCDFHFSTSLRPKDSLLKAINREISLQKDYLSNEPIATIYFGGGTPSLLSEVEIDTLLKTIHSTFTVVENAEITLEANPDDLTNKKLIGLKSVGINRLSIGVQSFDDTVLRFLNRSHTGARAIDSIQTARQLGFDNISLDLIYSIPNQPLTGWERNIDTALSLSPEHISAYSLTIEEKTAFGKWHKAGKLLEMEEEAQAQQFEALMELLTKNHYEHYEISNFCLPGFTSKHNSSYWGQQTYLGVGPSAHSFNGHSRQFNVANNWLYLQSLEKAVVPFTLEALTRENKINEYILTGIRTNKGIDLTYLEASFGFHFITFNERKLSQWLDNGCVEMKGNNIRLSGKGKLVADKIASDFFIDP